VSIDPDGRKEYSNDYKGELTEADWRIGDRLSNSQVWKNANDFNLRNKDFSQYSSIMQRAYFYYWAHHSLLEKGHRVYWPGAASIVAFKMGMLDMVTFDDSGVSKLANSGNKAIFDDVFARLSDLYTGNQILTGKEASTWDEATLKNEQYNVVQPIYNDASYITKAIMGGLVHFSHIPFGPRFKGNIMNKEDREDYGIKLGDFLKKQN
jgi:hypothetical protein